MEQWNALDNGMQASTVKLTYTSTYVRDLVQISHEKSFTVLSQTAKYFAKNVKTRKNKKRKKENSKNPNKDLSYLLV